MADLTVTINSTQMLVRPNGSQVLCINYTVTGLTNEVFSLAFRYLESGQTTPINMTGLTPNPDPVLSITSTANPTFPSGSNTVTTNFYWEVSTDLGNVSPSSVTVTVTPSGSVSGQSAVAGSTSFTFAPIAGASGAGGAGVGPGGSNTGRAQHTAHTLSPVSATNIAVFGGRNAAVAALNAIDRFSFAIGDLAYSVTGLTGQNGRVEHASSFYFDAQNRIKVLVTGGSLSGTPTNTADIYGFSPTESVTAAPNMTTARAGHSATWLPDNRVIIVGGRTTGGTYPLTCEIYDPATNAYTSIASLPAGQGREGHTTTLLPNGQILVAGGRGTSATTPLEALTYDPASNTWSSTGVTIDRYQHTATLLVNGVCYLVGGRKVSDNTLLATARAYRSFAQVLGSVTFAAGFSPTDDAMTSGRTEHATTRLGSGELLVVGGFGSSDTTLNSSELFLPVSFTAPTLGNFTPVATALANARARHTVNTSVTGSAVVIGGVNGSTSAFTYLDSIEVYPFSNSAPTATLSGANVNATNINDVRVTFTMNDAEGDRSFAFLQYSTDGGVTFKFARLNDFSQTVNLSNGSVTLHWNAGADGRTHGQSVVLKVIPVGGVFGNPTTATVTL